MASKNVYRCLVFFSLIDVLLISLFSNSLSIFAQVERLFPTESICGKFIRGNFTLTKDIICKGIDGPIAVGDNAIINLNGHSITGTGKSSGWVGVPVSHSNNVFINGPGSINNFQEGILTTGSRNTQVNNITFENNKIAVFVNNGSATIINNSMSSNTIGIASHSASSILISANLMTDNNLAGVSLVNSTNSHIEGNVIIGGGGNGIFLDSDSTSNAINDNKLQKNKIDINNADGLSPKINHNEFFNNDCKVSDPVGNCN